ncbi:MAG TPA: hypothetical protein VM600_05400 [Actinomycetota bacterium]|nr:hypothetical protein [Actinomycetota bacterium]
METVTIARRYNGPPDSGNGGYSCGVLGVRLGDCAEVRLRMPPPLDVPLGLEQRGDALVALHDDAVVAEARAATLDLEVPDPVGFEDAVTAAKSFFVESEHPFPLCFVCGPARAPGDGLRIFSGHTHTENVLAAPWVPDATIARDGVVAPEFLWAALDCPSGHGAFAQGEGRTMNILLGTLRAQIHAPVNVGEQCVVLGWGLGVEGRKYYGGSAVFGEDGTLRARAHAVWIQLR